MFLDTLYCNLDAPSGILHVQFPWDDGAVRIHPWESHCRTEVLQDGAWREDYHDFPIASGMLTGDDPMHPIARFTNALPESIVRTIGKYDYDQLAMVQACSQSDRAVDMLASAPTLLWYLAPYLVSNLLGDNMHEVLGEKRHVLIGRICGRSEPWLARFFSKFGPPTGTHSSREVLDTLLATPQALETLRHRTDITWDILRIAAANVTMFLSPLGRNLFKSHADVTAIRGEIRMHGGLLQDTARLGRLLGIAEYDSLINACKTYSQVIRLHERWSERMHHVDFIKIVNKKGNELPPPPLPGTEYIQPITTFYDLLVEGKTMRHCVGSYEGSVRSGASYIYKVLHPHRATLEIGFVQKQGWVIQQIKSHCNSDPGMETVRAVQDWLKMHRSENI